MKTFQTIVLAVFGFFIVAGVIVIASFNRSGSRDGEVPPTGTIWGTMETATVLDVFSAYNQENDSILSVTYKQFTPDEFPTALVEALAAQKGPDAILLSSSELERFSDIIYEVPFVSYTERTFRDTFADGADLFLTSKGTLAFPILVDPLVMFWNRDLLGAAGVAKPPSYWDEIVALVPKLTVSDPSFSITKSTIALGDFRNITNAKEILATLIMQAGNPIVARNANDEPKVTLADRMNLPEIPAESAIRFYTEFSNPVKPVYSWNRSLPNSRDYFLRGDLAFYLGFASELFDIREKNPNLDFDVARIPQVRDGIEQTTYGEMYAIALMKQSDNIGGAFRAATLLSDAQAAGFWSEKTGLPPMRRDVLAKTPEQAFKEVFYRDAIIAAGFLDPNPTETEGIFKDLVENVVSGGESVGQAIGQASGRLQNVVGK